MRAIISTLAGLAVLSVMLLAYGQGQAPDSELRSGLAKGSFLPVFNPQHVTGPDKGTQACPL